MHRIPTQQPSPKSSPRPADPIPSHTPQTCAQTRPLENRLQIQSDHEEGGGIDAIGRGQTPPGDVRPPPRYPRGLCFGAFEAIFYRILSLAAGGQMPDPPEPICMVSDNSAPPAFSALLQPSPAPLRADAVSMPQPVRTVSSNRELPTFSTGPSSLSSSTPDTLLSPPRQGLSRQSTSPRSVI